MQLASGVAFVYGVRFRRVVPSLLRQQLPRNTVMPLFIDEGDKFLACALFFKHAREIGSRSD